MKTELLAPAGTMDVFEAAVLSGADAVYVGAPLLNARRLSKDFSLQEIGTMAFYGKQAGVKMYLAMNSLLKEDEIPRTVHFLSQIAALPIDGLIIQDLGLLYLVRKYFPHLRVHASTLMGVHNSLGVAQLEELGVKRVVLARELSLEEIARIRSQTRVELEVFVHGAMCYSISGLCMFSSYLGGKSGLRGNCVQPCRRKYQWLGRGKKKHPGYFFSMHDLDGLEAAGQLIKLGINSLKIEGRMRNRQYVGNVVKGYRLLLDNDTADRKVLAAAGSCFEAALSRTTSSGYFFASNPGNAINPFHSGNIGRFLGKIQGISGNNALLTTRETVALGDRLRLHSEGTGERASFTVKKITDRQKRSIPAAASAETVYISIPVPPSIGDSIFKIDLSEQRTASGLQIGGEQRRALARIKPFLSSKREHEILNELGCLIQPKKIPERQGRPHKAGRQPTGKNIPFWVKTTDIGMLLKGTDKKTFYILSLDHTIFPQYMRNRKKLAHFRSRLCWSLPPVIYEENIAFYQDCIQVLQKDGFTRWMVNNIGQLRFFGKSAGQDGGISPAEVYGDYQMNILNSLAVKSLQSMGVRRCIFSIETTRENLQLAAVHGGARNMGVIVYAKPPLFVSRLACDHFDYGRDFQSPRNEKFILKRYEDLVLAFAEEPFSWLPMIPEISACGVDFLVVDFSYQKVNHQSLQVLFQGPGGRQVREKTRLFNYQNNLF